MRETIATATASTRDASFSTVSTSTSIAPSSMDSAPSVTTSTSTATNTSTTSSMDTRPRTANSNLYMRHRFTSAAQFSSQFGMPSLIRVNNANGFLTGGTYNSASGRISGGGDLVSEIMTPIRSTSTVNIRPQFRTKVVCDLKCGDCGVLVCQRGMRAILLADTNVELFSTDCPPIGLNMVNDDYVTRNCNCRIRDVACLNCGNLVGYHVTQPCDACMEACNNGHFWMFHIDSVKASERIEGSKVLLWSQLMFGDKEPKETEYVCR